MSFAQKDAAIVEQKREVGDLRTQNTELSCGLHEEINNRKLAVVCAENLTRQNDIQVKKVMTLSSRVTELENELAQEKDKHIADKGANEKLRSITEKWNSTRAWEWLDKSELRITEPDAEYKAHAAVARSSLTALIKDLRAQERQVLSLSSALDKERLEHEKHIEDLETTQAKELATVNENHDRQLAQIEVRHSEELTRVKLWCVMNQPRPNELSRVLERQRRSALEAEVEKTKEKAEMRHSWQDARIQELERENDQVKHQLANLQRDSQWKNWMKTIMS
ncbi:hypothetical protein J4E86_005497 [Alternaria arbusti]|uniref:uncharacterized protein n=1 Tax=Alternaria arbusti TaxID=232088 RepID=UPI00221F27B0|nr:uncharacterized protein J4E86_005497 [Alternaria arbusti]KAI4957025.1 hypothetical protein J4E86_005497 [Alternaria arbusti]